MCHTGKETHMCLGKHFVRSMVHRKDDVQTLAAHRGKVVIKKVIAIKVGGVLHLVAVLALDCLHSTSSSGLGQGGGRGVGTGRAVHILDYNL